MGRIELEEEFGRTEDLHQVVSVELDAEDAVGSAAGVVEVNAVVVIDKELLRRAHYLRQIEHNFPAVCKPAESERINYETERAKWANGEDFDPEVIDRAYYAYINRIIMANYATRPIYVTLEVEPQVGEGFVRVPEGLAFRLYRDFDFPSPSMPVWDDFQYRPAKHLDKYTERLISSYPTMLTNRGIFYHQGGLFAEADRYFDRALRFDSDFGTAATWRDRNQEAQAAQAAQVNPVFAP